MQAVEKASSRKFEFLSTVPPDLHIKLKKFKFGKIVSITQQKNNN